MRERHESEMGLLNELMNNKQIKREEMVSLGLLIETTLSVKNVIVLP